MATTITDYFFQTLEYWNKRGVPIEVWLKAGPFWKMVQKMTKPTWAGDGNMKVPLYVSYDGNIGSAYQRVFANHETLEGVQFSVPVRECWTTTQLTWLFMSLAKESGLVSAMSGKQTEMMTKVTAYMKAMSYLVWSDGTGRLSKGDGAYSVAGATIKLLNRVSINRFEKGDVLVFIDQGAAVPAGGKPTPRGGTVTVASVSRATGELTCTGNVNAGIATAVNTDYIGKKVDFEDGGDDSTEGIIDGYFRYVPITATEAATTLFGVTRSDDVQRLSGDRIELTGNESPWQIVTKIGRRARENDAPITHIFVPTNQIEDLSAEMAARNVIVDKAYETQGDRKTLTMGYSAMRVLVPGMERPVEILDDKYLCDINLAETADKTYVGVTMPHLHVHTTSEGIAWQNYSGQGVLDQTIGRQRVSGSYGAYMNLAHYAPGHDVIASTRANL